MTPRERALFLREARPHAAELLDLYLALLDVWEDGPTPERVLKAVEASGPAPLAASVRELLDRAADLLERWARGGELEPAQRFLARACRPEVHGKPATSRHCPHCGGLPQLSIRSLAGDPLTRGQRQLMCSRCSRCWNYTASSCPGCGELAGSQRTFYADAGTPSLRVEACATCGKYVIDVDLARDPDAVPEIDELTALPLDLYAADLGLSKVTPNLMGF